MIIGNENYDFTEFESTAEYKGDFAAEHPVIKNFWSVFHELTTEQKKKFLGKNFSYFEIKFLNLFKILKL